MKKNKIMRIASILLIAVLLSTSIISGTFAKYVTEGSVTDSARVAKFGVVVTATGSLFDWTYKKANDNTPGGHTPDSTPFTDLTVESGTNVVAPGTKNTTGLTFGVSGTPEVDVKVKFAVTNVSDVFLINKAGLPNMTTADTTDKFENTTKYYPVKYTLKGEYLKAATLGDIEGLDTSKKASEGAVTGTLANIKAVLEAINTTSDIYVDAGTNLATAIGSFTLTWEWDYGNFDSDTGHDKQDTLLGDIAAKAYATGTESATVELDNVTLTKDVDYCLNAGIKITVTVTQVD